MLWPFFATSSQKIKIHFVESQITLLVWPCLSLTEKQHTINHMFIFNDLISKFYKCSIRGMAWGIWSRHVYVFYYLSRPKKKNSELIKFLGIVKNYVSKKEIYFCLKKKSNVLLKHSAIFKFGFIMNDLLFYPQISVFSFHTYFVLFYQFLKTLTLKKMLALPFSHNWQKSNNKVNEKRSQEYQNVDPGYITGQINIPILELFWDNFVVWLIGRVKNFKMI